MINFNAQIALQIFIEKTIKFPISYQCAIMSEITLNITVHGSNCYRLLRHLIP